MIPYEFCVFNRKAVSFSLRCLSTRFIISELVAHCATFHGSRIRNNAADEFSFAVVSFSGKDNQ